MFVDYKNIRVFYTPELEGGGMDFGQDYIPVVRKMFGKVDRCCEFGAGPGFIGFSLLAHGLCDSLTLVDINPAAVKMLRKTVKENHLEGRVRIYLSDGLRKVNKNEKWDLVVSNPPHFNGAEKRYTQDVRVYDPGWRIHKEFYSKAAKFLSRDGSILFVENRLGGGPNIWKKMIAECGLKYQGSFRHRAFGYPPKLSDIKMFLRGEKGFMKKSSPAEVLLKSAIHASYTFYYPYYFVWSKKH